MKVFSKIHFFFSFLILTSIPLFSSCMKSDNHAKVARIWRGYTSEQNADEFERILINEAIPAIEKNKPEGYLGIELLRNELGNEVEFTTIMKFSTLESVKAFAGTAYQKAHIDPRVASLLLRYDTLVSHHQIRFHKSHL